MKLSVILPVHNGGQDFRRCLTALAASSRPPDEIIVVDDASTDSSSDVGRCFGAHVLPLERTPRGPAFARNAGVSVAQGDILVFIDADVLVHQDTLALIQDRLEAHPDISAIFGSYDNAPPKSGLVSRYKNLQHHYVHQHARQEASTFWAGCGAIRRDVFLKFEGFDHQHYSRPSIEDIELGLRLTRAGYRIWLCPEVQVAHLKQWSLLSLLHSDVIDRAVPWTRLILSTSHLPSDLNLDTKSRLSVIAVWTIFASLGASFRFPPAGIGVLVSVLALIGLNLGLYKLFIEQGGLGFGIGAMALHSLYYLYSSLVFGTLLFLHFLQRLRSFILHCLVHGRKHNDHRA